MHTDLRDIESQMSIMEKKYHFIGIGGIGMSALARILLQRGCQVTGSDLSPSALTDQLQLEGANICIGHSQDNLKDPNVVIYSTAVNKENPEVQAACEKQVPFLHRAELLKELMEGYAPLLVTGTHGKTTTSSLLAHVLIEAGLKPSYAVGGIVCSLGNNGGHGTGPYFVAEADESDGSFLKYRPFGAIMTNIDNDHLDFWKNEEAILAGFKQFADSVVSPEHFLWGGDDEKLRSLNLKGMSYGFDEHNDLIIESFRQTGWKIVFDISFKEKVYSDIEIPLIGGHNVLNSAAVFGLGLCLNIPEASLRAAFKSFKGVSRRMEKKGEANGIVFYDDYAHHPTEIYATLRAVKHAIGKHRLVVVFQPHRYTRTRDSMAEFGTAFDHADVVILTDIYAAGEKPIEGVTTDALYAKIQETVPTELHYVPRKKLAAHLASLLKPQDVLVTLGAGDITKLCSEVIPLIAAKT
ncbi:MAG: UDP-N-acetylmuramate--L-alanine ligase [Verrucomicrobia bacterium]|nr:UDP-N-acetylmuramate--L-alanine ligase [Verrucomicrobiota bacterium]